MRLKSQSQKTILVVGDPHTPFMHKDAIAFLGWVKRVYKPDTVVFIGDEIDAHGISNWPKDPDGMSAGDEHNAALRQLKQLYKLFPVAKCCKSNHTDRVWRRAYDAGMPKQFIKTVREVLQAPDDWDWSDKWLIDDICFEHGEGFSGQLGHMKATMANMRSTVIGHLHSWAGINYYANADQLIFGMNVGCLLDLHAYAFAYGKHIKAKPIIGVGLIIRGAPIYIPMLLNHKGDWIKPS